MALHNPLQFDSSKPCGWFGCQGLLRAVGYDQSFIYLHGNARIWRCELCGMIQKQENTSWIRVP